MQMETLPPKYLKPIYITGKNVVIKKEPIVLPVKIEVVGSSSSVSGEAFTTTTKSVTYSGAETFAAGAGASAESYAAGSTETVGTGAGAEFGASADFTASAGAGAEFGAAGADFTASTGAEFSAGAEFGGEAAGAELRAAGADFGAAGAEFGASAGAEFGASAGAEFEASAGAEFGGASAGAEFGGASAGAEFGGASAGAEFGGASTGAEFGGASAEAGDLGDFKLLRRGAGISLNEQTTIARTAKTVIDQGLLPLSNNTANLVKKNLGGDWLVIVYPHQKPIDFNMTCVQGNDYLYFSLGGNDYQVCRIT